uniref:ABC transmembrane type-1 domain-containing protein n=1 Tax=Rhabditophanes sp. KR3021 TaxID=114890 RepID=A0AC35U750_9BILA
MDTRRSSSRTTLVRPLLNTKSAILAHYQESKRIQFVKNSIWVSILTGVILNVFGSFLGYLRAEIDEKVVEAAIDKKFIYYGMVKLMNETLAKQLLEKDFYVPSSIVRVLLTTAGRMMNVIGTMKIFRGFSSYLSEKKRLRLRVTAERFMDEGEGHGEWSDALAECCQLCAA